MAAIGRTLFVGLVARAKRCRGARLRQLKEDHPQRLLLLFRVICMAMLWPAAAQRAKIKCKVYRAIHNYSKTAVK